MKRSLARFWVHSCLRMSLVLALDACGNASSDPENLSHTLEFGTLGTARIEGRAVSLSGAPLDSVLVAARVVGPASDFTVISSTTGSDGRFQVELRRIKAATGVYIQMDTQTVVVYGSALKLKYRGTDGALPSDSAQVLLRLAPAGASVIPVSVALHVPVP